MKNVHVISTAYSYSYLTPSPPWRDLTLDLPALAAGSYQQKPAGEIRGSGYVVDCLEAALWCFQTTDTFAQAVLAAANLGADADTTAAVCGQVAGAYYGLEGIPARWLERLTMREMITELADQLCDPAGREPTADPPR